MRYMHTVTWLEVHSLPITGTWQLANAVEVSHRHTSSADLVCICCRSTIPQSALVELKVRSSTRCAELAQVSDRSKLDLHSIYTFSACTLNTCIKQHSVKYEGSCSVVGNSEHRLHSLESISCSFLDSRRVGLPHGMLSDLFVLLPSIITR